MRFFDRNAVVEWFRRLAAPVVAKAEHLAKEKSALSW